MPQNNQVCLQLHEPARQGQYQQVQQLLSEGADVNEAGTQRATPLHAAAAGGYSEVVQLLLAAGASVNAADTYGWTPLHTADKGHPAVVQQLLAAGANVNAAAPSGWTPLHAAADAGHPQGGLLRLVPTLPQAEVVQLLLTSGASVNAADTDGQTPLHTAAYWGRSEVVQLLLQAGANPQARDDDDKTPLYCAATGHVSVHDDGYVRSVQLLLDAWGEPQIPAADLILAASDALNVEKLAAFALLAKELQRRHPAEVHQLFDGRGAHIVANAAAAMAAAWVADVSSIDEQRAAVCRREEDVASEKQAVQQLILGVAGMTKAAEQKPAELSVHHK